MTSTKCPCLVGLLLVWVPEEYRQMRSRGLKTAIPVQVKVAPQSHHHEWHPDCPSACPLIFAAGGPFGPCCFTSFNCTGLSGMVGGERVQLPEGWPRVMCQHFCTLSEVTCDWKQKLLTMCCCMFYIFFVRRASQDPWIDPVQQGRWDIISSPRLLRDLLWSSNQRREFPENLSGLRVAANMHINAYTGIRDFKIPRHTTMADHWQLVQNLRDAGFHPRQAIEQKKNS